MTEQTDSKALHALDTDLGIWWMHQAQEDIGATVPKAIEYGSQDLIDLGRDCAGLLGRRVTDAEAIEYAVWFYLRGKLARWTAALRRGERVSDDTVFDIGIYAKMVQRVREVGSWPGDEQVVPHRDWPDAELAERLEDERITGPYQRAVEGVRQAQQAVTEMTEQRDGEPEENPEMFQQPPEVVEGKQRVAEEGNQAELRRSVGRFMTRLIDNGYHWFISDQINEVRHDGHQIEVSAQYSGKEWQIAIRAAGNRLRSPIRIRVTEAWLETTQFSDLLEMLTNGRLPGPGYPGVVT